MKALLNITYAIVFSGLIMSISNIPRGNSIMIFGILAAGLLNLLQVFSNLKEGAITLMYLGTTLVWTAVFLWLIDLPYLIVSAVGVLALIIYYGVKIKSASSRIVSVLIFIALITSSGIVLSLGMTTQLSEIVLTVFSIIVVLAYLYLLYTSIQPNSDAVVNFSGYLLVFSLFLMISSNKLGFSPDLFSEKSVIEQEIENKDLSLSEKHKLQEELSDIYDDVDEILN